MHLRDLVILQERHELKTKGMSNIYLEKERAKGMCEYV